jgi:hypothetical protein
LTESEDGLRQWALNVLHPYAGSDRPLPPEDDPNRALARVFADLTRDPAELARIRAHRLSVLDHVVRRYQRLSVRLGAADRQKLEAHLGSIREIEARLSLVPPPRPACQPPAPSASLDLMSNDAFPAIGKVQMDLLVMALACDLTRVASLQWSRAASTVHFSWLDIEALHHDLSHRGDNDADAIDKLTPGSTAVTPSSWRTCSDGCSRSLKAKERCSTTR